VRAAGNVKQQLAFGKNAGDQRDIREVRPAFIWIIEDDDISGPICRSQLPLSQRVALNRGEPACDRPWASMSPRLSKMAQE